MRRLLRTPGVWELGVDEGVAGSKGWLCQLI